MTDAIRHLDQRFAALRPLKDSRRPPHGWIRAVRDALGMTTAQLARRLGVSQPRIVAIEKAEVSGALTLHSLERAAEALGCRVVYTLLPEQPLADTVLARAEALARRNLAAVDQTMRLEDQEVAAKTSRAELLRDLVADLVRNPARLWDDA
ncbi:MAG: mobile mystery protein A [Rhizomicrobium sp.]